MNFRIQYIKEIPALSRINKNGEPDLKLYCKNTNDLKFSKKANSVRIKLRGNADGVIFSDKRRLIEYI